MKINWKVRFKNKTFLLTFIPFLLSFVYQLLAMFGVTPKISENDVFNIVTQIINALALLGIVVDCTTCGVGDSSNALTYDKPAK